MNLNKIKNLGKINKKIIFLLQKTKYSFLSPENKYSLYSIDCLSNGVKVFIIEMIFLTKTNSNMIPANYNNFDLLLKVIKKKIK